MHVNTVDKLHTVLPALAQLTLGTVRSARKGNALRLYRATSVLLAVESTRESLITLLKAGHTVKVYEQDRIYTVTLDGDTLLWAFRTSRKFRATAVVEVAL